MCYVTRNDQSGTPHRMEIKNVNIQGIFMWLNGNDPRPLSMIFPQLTQEETDFLLYGIFKDESNQRGNTK